MKMLDFVGFLKHSLIYTFAQILFSKPLAHAKRFKLALNMRCPEAVRNSIVRTVLSNADALGKCARNCCGLRTRHVWPLLAEELRSFYQPKGLLRGYDRF